jgi:hypothetical protein
MLMAPSARRLIQLALLAGVARRSVGKQLPSVDSFRHQMQQLVDKDTACATKIEQVTRTQWCKAHCLAQRTHGSRTAPQLDGNSENCLFWRHLSRVVTWSGHVPPSYSRGLLTLLGLSVANVSHAPSTG